jgi:hypothetical protein
MKENYRCKKCLCKNCKNIACKSNCNFGYVNIRKCDLGIKLCYKMQN